MKKTNISIENGVKNILGNLGSTGESYNEVLKRVLLDTLTNDDDLNKFLTNTSHSVKACFYLGVLEDKVYERNAINNKIWDKITKINRENFIHIYSDFIAKSENKYDDLTEKLSSELMASNKLIDIDDDEIAYYYVLGRSLAHKFK